MTAKITRTPQADPAEVLAFNRLQGLTAAEVAALALWKVRGAVRRVANGAGGFGRMRREGERWGGRWREATADTGGLPAWLARTGAGKFWIPVDEAPGWARQTCTPADLRVAAAAAAGEFDLIGSGRVSLGRPPAWRRDLYSGFEWPLIPSHRVRYVRGDGSDVRTVWELSRGYHLLQLARGYWSTGDTSFTTAFVEHVDSWIEQNPLGLGPHWSSPMDVAIRAANWVLALHLFAEAEGVDAGVAERVLANLYASALFLERHLEWHPVYRGNHFVSNGVGLVYLGTLFRGTRAGERWLRTGARIVTDELLVQVTDDGVSFEASLAYHRLVTELFAFGGDLVRRNLPGAWQSEHERRLDAMYRFIAAYLPESGAAPMLGDADDGRLHSVSAEGLLRPRFHRLGLPGGHWPGEPPASEAFPVGGFFVMRRGGDHVVVRCGRVGLRGAGSHDHNDQLSFELVLDGRRVVSDSGTFLYSDPAARYAFRATAAHSVVQLGGAEQNPIRQDRLWRILADRTRSECTRWEVADGRTLFEGRHFGYAHLDSGAVCRRRIEAEGAAAGSWRVEDVIEGKGSEDLAWRMHLADPATRVEADAEAGIVRLTGEPAVRIRIEAPPGLAFSVESSEISDRYGERRLRACLVLRGRVELPATISATFQVGR